MTFEEDFPSLKGLKVAGHPMDRFEIQEHCLDKQKVKEAIAAAVLGVMFEGYDINSEIALCEMQKYIYKELGLE